ncbi:RNI-like protein [Rhizophagus irregularis]|uniref:RNI-like protein n=1 Tax=Rhizophagus irregularis TaxID=588596 RepID=A0A2N0R0T7_9GLOM|nr:RNI-like protein [Rhizophagus irregularis]PKC71579.1 RNI-like protein [Rhizophagus irregularis]
MALALPEILNKILNVLAKDNTLYPTFLVSKLDRFINSLQYLVIAHHSNLLNEIIEKIVQKFSKYNSSRFSRFGGNIGWAEKSLCEIAHGSCNKLKHLGISGYQNLITDSIIHNIAESYLILQSLDISDCNRLTDTAIYTITGLYPNLRSLKLKHCDGISDTAIRKIAQHHYLEYLKLCTVKEISNSSISKIATCSSIVYLYLGHAEFVFNTTLKAVAEHLNSVEYLGLKNCYRVSQKIVNKIFPDLKIGGYYTLPI